MNSVGKELLSSIIYASNAHKVWLDLKEKIGIVNESRIFYLHREIVTLAQETMSVAEYFFRIRNRGMNLMHSCLVQAAIVLSIEVMHNIMVIRDFYSFLWG